MKDLIRIRFLICFAAAFIFVAALCYYFARPLIEKTLPLLTLPISLIHPNIEARPGLEGRNVIFLDAVAVEEEAVGFRTQTVRGNFMIRQDIGTIFGTTLIFLPLLLSWPGIPFLSRLKAAAWTFPILLLIIMMDLSLTFLLEIEKRLVTSSPAADIRFYLAQGLNAGGRQVLGLVLFAAAMAPRFLKKPDPAPGPAPGRNDPCPCGSGKKYKNCCMP